VKSPPMTIQANGTIDELKQSISIRHIGRGKHRPLSSAKPPRPILPMNAANLSTASAVHLTRWNWRGQLILSMEELAF
jgi:hypothetical protein